MNLFKNEIINILYGTYISTDMIVNTIIEEIETQDGKVKRFINRENNETNFWESFITITIKNTDTIEDLKQRIMYDLGISYYHINFTDYVEEIQGTIFSHINSSNDIVKVYCISKIESII